MEKKVDSSLNLLVLGGSVGVAFLLYFPILGNTFLSDDYDSLYRILVSREWLFKNFLRPIIDISFYFNYLVSGTDAWSYYVFNVTVHGLNGWLLYRLALRFTLFEATRQRAFAMTAAFLFLIYPFHSESIVWLSGRLSSIATTCGLAALWLMLDARLTPAKRWLAIFIYLVGLHAYESILFLPLLIVVLRWRQHAPYKELVRELLLWSSVMVAYLVWRHFISGVVYNDYASHMVDSPVVRYGSQVLKTLGRTVLPPVENSKLMIFLFAAAVLVIIAGHIWLYRQLRLRGDLMAGYIQLLLAFMITLLIPVLFGVSTRTTEGDRLLYWPSCFLCMMLAQSIVILFRQLKYRIMVLAILSAVAIVFIQQTNQRWVQASQLAKATFRLVQPATQRPVVLVNLPGELDGAFVFRNGFYPALLVKGMDTAGIRVANHLSRLEQLRVTDSIVPVNLAHETVIFPATHLIDAGGDTIEVKGSQNRYIATINKRSGTLYYWNNKRWTKFY